MKRIFALLLLPMLTQAKEVDMKTTITDVTVFQSGAQVYRTGEVTIPAGEHDIVISDATALLKKESIQVKGEGDFTILSVNHQSVLEDIDNQKAKWPELEAKQKDLMRQMEELSVKIQVLNSEEKTINNLKDIATTTKGVTVEQVSKADDAIALRLAQVKNEKLKYSRQVLDLFEQYKEVTQHLVALKTPKQRVRYEIVVKVLAKSEVKGKFSVNYVVPNAGWTPAYDIRVKTVSDPMLIEYKANVSQQSGEDWNNIKLKLSTGDPSRTSTKPDIESWWLYINQPYSQPGSITNFYDNKVAQFTIAKGVLVNAVTGKPLPWASVMVPGSTVGTMTDADGKFSLLLPENAKQLNFYCIGYSSGAIAITAGDMVARLSRLPMPLNQTVKTDYEKQLMTLQSPIFDSDYEKELMTLDVPVDPIYEQNYTSGGYSMQKEMENKMSMDYDEVQKLSKNYMENDKSEYREMKTPTVTKTLNIVSTEYSIEEKYTILSDPKNVSIPVQTIKVDAHYQYFCA
ncbi:MAG TPA: mucoidy inhibitor MuiA family protein, partial [Bacteroidia bacterium]